MKTKNRTIPYAESAGLTAALCALSFFRARHRRTGNGRKARRNLNDYCSYTKLAREHIRRARAAGWRGSIIAALQQPVIAAPASNRPLFP